jgi:hypothetical protein
MKINQSIEKLLGGNTDRQTRRQAGDLTSLFSFFK